MKTKIILIVDILLIVLLVVSVISGIKIGKFKILSISDIKDKNEDLNMNINKASTLTSSNYPQAIGTLEDTYSKYLIKKQKYEEISGFSDTETKKVIETKKYDISYLWKIVGNYATKYNLTISMDVKKNNLNLYDLHFNVGGQYVNISEFIKEIENNSDLYFRIYNFNMGGDSTKVVASFIVKDINVDPKTIINTSNANSLE